MTDISGFLKAQMLMNDRENVVYNMIILAILEMLTGFIRRFYDSFSKYINQYIDKKMNHVELKMTKMDNPQHVLYFERDWKTSGNWDRADSLLHYILSIPESQSFLIVANLEIIKNGDPFKISKDVYFQMTNLDMNNGIIEHIEFKIYSETLDVCQLRKLVDEIEENYIIEQKNNLGNKLYFFDHVVQKNTKRGDYINKLLFTQHLFRTNRNLDNVFHERQDELKDRVNFFLDNKEWYDKRGVPYTLGLMLYGTPGTGKSSSIKAVANVTQRHIININLGSIKSQKQLKKLFYDEKIVVCPDPETPSRNVELIIPIEKRLFVIEDADALIDSDILKKREDKDDQQFTRIAVPQKRGMSFTNEDEQEECDLDLATILNIIDGSLETPGRILIITSNHPEKFDSAFIRPGRIDMLIEFKKANRKVIKDMIISFYGLDICGDVKHPRDNMDNSEIEEGILNKLENVEDYRWTPAEVAQILFKNFGDSDKAIKDLIELQDDYFVPKIMNDGKRQEEDEELR